MPATILLIEDDRRIRELLPRYFTRAGLQVITAADGMGGLARLEAELPALVLLDVNLPDLDGWSVLRRIRNGASPDLPVILLTGRSDVPDRLLGLDLGADDYIVKPFEPLEVVARVKAVLRRAGGERTAQEELIFPGLRLDLAGRSARRNDHPLNLTAKEFDLLIALASRQGRVMTRLALCEAAWSDDDFTDDHTLDVHLNRLRKKLAGQDGITYLVTLRGIGYKFEVRHGEA